MPVDIGEEAITRSSARAPGATFINKGNPATNAGEVTSIDIYVDVNITGLIVGTFYTTNGNTLKCRASEVIAGTINVGSKVVKAVSLAVEIGDYIGCYYPAGQIWYDAAGQGGFWDTGGEHIDPDDEAVYVLDADSGMSLGGYITVEPEDYEVSSAIDTGIAVTAERLIGATRNSDISLGEVVTATRRVDYIRTAEFLR